MTDYAALLPVNVVTGFLGSGKTTLIGRLLRAPRLRDTAVLVNELGEVGLDHHLLQQVAESTLLLANGCLCCAMRGDLGQALRGLFSRRERGEVPRFRRVLIETSGLADPVPIAYTLLAEPVIQHHFRLGKVVTVVDAVNGARALDRYPESLKQVAVADRIVLAKTDLCAAAEVSALRARLQQVNPAAALLDCRDPELDAERLLLEDLYDPERKLGEVRRWLGGAGEPPAGGDAAHHAHDGEIRAFSLRFGAPLDWTAFGIWMTMLLHRHGDRVLRIKGLLNVAGLPAPVLINGVQHIVHPPAHLPAWPDPDHRSRIVFIVRGLAQARLEASLAVFNGLANRPRAARN